jgi:rhodanese-related sulfurtransferase
MKRVGFVFALAVAAVLLVLPAPEPGGTGAAPGAGPGQVSPEQLAAWIVAGDPGYLLVDVRPAAAFEAGAIRTAVSMPAEALDAAAVARLPAHRRIVLYCDTGARSGAVAASVAATRDGVYVLEGGLHAWRARVLRPPPPAADAPPDAWLAYRERAAVAAYFSGDAGAVPPAAPQQVRPVLRPRPPLQAGEGC